MKIKLYMDVFRGQKDGFHANSNPFPGTLSDHQKRFHFVVDIPDSALTIHQGEFTHVDELKEVSA